MKPWAIDLCCGAGAATRGYQQAGFRVLGVDINPQPSYIGDSFIQADITDLDLTALVKMVRAVFVHVSPPCFPAGTPVLTARGMVPIEEVVVGDSVLTHRNRWRQVTATMDRDAETWSSRWMAATPDHPYWAKSKLSATPGWMTASGLEGMYLAIPAAPEELEVPVVKAAMGREFWYMVGRWLGDGWVYRVQAEVKSRRAHGKLFTEQQVCPGCGGPSARSGRWTHLWNAYCSRPCSMRVNRATRATPRAEVLICCADTEANDLATLLADTGLHWRRSQERTTTRFTAVNTELCDWLTTHFGKGARGKTMPGWVFGMKKEHRAALFNGYRDADGYKASDGGWGITTVSAQLAFSARLLGTGLGWNTQIALSQPAREVCTIEGRVVNTYPFWQLRFNKSDRYSREIDGHRWINLRKPFKLRGFERVYDLTVADDHSFVAWGFVVHNCQRWSRLARYQPELIDEKYPDLVSPTRERLVEIGLPFVMENVPQAPLVDPVLLCGTMFGLFVERHRSFEPHGFALAQPHHVPRTEHPRCVRNGYLPTPDRPAMSIHGGKHSRAWQRAACQAMGAPWMAVATDATGDEVQAGIREISESIPPAYTRWVGGQLLEQLARGVAA